MFGFGSSSAIIDITINNENKKYLTISEKKGEIR